MAVERGQRDNGKRRSPSMADVAALAGVSHQTVSRVLNDSPLVREDTRTRVNAAIRELGYRRNAAARLLVTNRSGRIGMVSAHLALYGPSMIAEAVQEAGREAGYDVAVVGVLDLTEEALQRAVDRLLDQAVEALVVAVAHRDAHHLVRGLSLPIPVVLAQGVSPGEAMAAGIDQVAGARLATDHLLDLGHHAVAHVSGPRDWTEAEQRREGWRQAHEARGLLPGPELPGDWSAASGYDAGQRLAKDRDLSAIFVANDSMALGVLRALHEAGRAVPNDVSVVGFDNVPEGGYYWPALTTVAQDFPELGRRAVELAVRALGGEDRPTAELAQPVMLVRGSTGKNRTR
jgi:DNA-binding LacI/PurR family transcriptional regulator